MNLHVLSPHKNGDIDPTVKRNLLDFLPNQVGRGEADVLVIPISFFHDFTFYNALWDEHRPWVMVDFLEYGNAWDKKKTHIFGKNSLPSNIQSQEWDKFDQWVKANPPILTFKRELLERDRSLVVLPIEFACYIEAQPMETLDQWFTRRPLELFYNWGYSHVSRPKLHGDIFHGMTTHGIDVISHWDQFHQATEISEGGHQKPRRWAAIHTPHYTRQHISKVMEWQRSAKITVSLPGNGQICFRSTEAPVDSIMAHQKNGMAHAFPWIDGVNCIEMEEGKEFESLEAAANRSYNLFDVYCGSYETIDKYRSSRFALEYIYPAIEAAL